MKKSHIALIALVVLILIAGGWMLLMQRAPKEGIQTTSTRSAATTPTTAGDFTFTTDASHVYQDGTLIPEADPRTFEVLAGGDTGPIAAWYAKDAKHVYYGPESVQDWGIIPSADPNTFSVVTLFVDWAVAKDTSHVFLANHVVDGADAPTFSMKTKGTYRVFSDKNKIWWVVDERGTEIDQVNWPASLTN